MTDIYDEMYHLRNQRDAARRVIMKAEAEAARLRDALQAIAAECSFAPDSENNETVRWVLHTSRVALDAGEDR